MEDIMTKYIDMEILRKEIERLKERYNEQVSAGLISESLVSMGKVEALNKVLAFIDSLQQEQPNVDLKKAVSEQICIAADKHIKRVVDAAGHPGWDWSTQDIADAFKAGAEWMKEQLTEK